MSTGAVIPPRAYMGGKAHPAIASRSGALAPTGATPEVLLSRQVAVALDDFVILSNNPRHPILHFCV